MRKVPPSIHTVSVLGALVLGRGQPSGPSVSARDSTSRRLAAALVFCLCAARPATRRVSDCIGMLLRHVAPSITAAVAVQPSRQWPAVGEYITVGNMREDLDELTNW